MTVRTVLTMTKNSGLDLCLNGSRVPLVTTGATYECDNSLSLGKTYHFHTNTTSDIGRFPRILRSRPNSLSSNHSSNGSVLSYTHGTIATLPHFEVNNGPCQRRSAKDKLEEDTLCNGPCKGLSAKDRPDGDILYHAAQLAQFNIHGSLREDVADSVLLQETEINQISGQSSPVSSGDSVSSNAAIEASQQQQRTHTSTEDSQDAGQQRATRCRSRRKVHSKKSRRKKSSGKKSKHRPKSGIKHSSVTKEQTNLNRNSRLEQLEAFCKPMKVSLSDKPVKARDRGPVKPLLKAPVPHPSSSVAKKSASLPATKIHVSYHLPPHQVSNSWDCLQPRMSVDGSGLPDNWGRLTKVYLSERQSGLLKDAGLEFPCAPPGTPLPETLRRYEFVPSLSDVRAQRAVKIRLETLEKLELKRKEKLKEEQAKKDKAAAKEKEREIRHRQRREIYALNKVMTEFEYKNFESFCKENGIDPMK